MNELHAGGPEPVQPEEQKQEKEPISFTREIKPDEVENLDPDQVPFESLVVAIELSGEPRFQTLELPDPKGVGINDYRRNEINQVQAALAGHRVVGVIGPSRSGKTEALAIGAYNERNSTWVIPREATLLGQPAVAYVDVKSFNTTPFLELPLLRFIKQRVPEGTDEVDVTVIVDEFGIDATSKEILKSLRLKGYKLVLLYGGRLSNEHKKKVLVQHLHDNGIEDTVPIIEMGVKPLNSTQVAEIFERDYIVGELQPGWDETVLRQIAKDTLVSVATKLPLTLHVVRQFLVETQAVVTSLSEVSEHALQQAIIAKLTQLSKLSHANVFPLNEVKTILKDEPLDHLAKYR